MITAALLLASLYSLPDGLELPAPDADTRVRIEEAMTLVRRGDGAEAERAVRALALVGEAALPAIVRRLNEAQPGERLLLLSAVSRMPRAASLLEQASRDPSPAIRAWRSGPPARDPESLKYLAARYLDLLALAEEKSRIDAEQDLQGLDPRVGRPTESFDSIRKRMRDRALADSIQAQRRRAARSFAVAGGRALRSGELKPSRDDPLFMAYLGLLREEDLSFLYALTALVSAGEPVAPVLEPLLERENHDPRKLARILCTVRSDRGLGLFDGLTAHRPDVQRALVRIAPETLDGKDLGSFLEKAAVGQDRSVRTAALDSLLELESPAGRAAGQTLLQAGRYEPADLRRATLLLARCGDLEPLIEYAAIDVPKDGSEMASWLENARRFSIAALRAHRDVAGAALGERVLGSESKRLRVLGIDLVSDPEKLLAHARRETEPVLARTAADRALELGGKPLAPQVLEFLRAGEDGRLPARVLPLLRRHGCVEILIELARDPGGDLRHGTLSQLGQLPALDARYEEALLGIYDAEPPGPRKRVALKAILPLGTPEVRRRFVEAGDLALGVLKSRFQAGGRIPFALPLLRFLKDADPEQLALLREVAGALPSVEPGIFYALYQKWGSVGLEDPEAADGEASPAKARIDLLNTLARSEDRASARALFSDLLARRIEEPYQVLGILKVSARLVPPETLVQLTELLRAQVKEEYPTPDRRPQPPSDYRWYLLRGGIKALAQGGANGALGTLCDIVLDPSLQPAAFDYKGSSNLPWAALDALRAFRLAAVDSEFRSALQRAEATGRLAALEPDHLYNLLRHCHEQRWLGRSLYEVSLALSEVLLRLPWEEGDLLYQRTRTLGGLRRYGEAAAAARACVSRKRASDFRAEDGYWTPERVEGRALLYEALAAGDAGMVRTALPSLDNDPFLLYLATWYALFDLGDLEVADETGRAAVASTAGLNHLAREILAAVRNAQGRPVEALKLLDLEQHLPVKRQMSTGWHFAYQAKAEMLLGNETGARRALENALTIDRRILPTVRADPLFRGFDDLFRQVDDDFFDRLFTP
ncbi:MAG: hypothetical protein ACYTGV_06675 [Planctomycetota bacterium]